MTTPALPPRPAAYRPWRLVATTLAVLAVIALGIVAGRWQWDRYEVRADALAAQERADGAPVVDLASLVSPADADAGHAQWREVEATGTLDANAMMEIRGRSIDRTATIQYVTWLHVPDGAAVLVNLGWEPRTGATPPALPSGTVTVTGIVRDLEPVNDKPGTRITPAHMTDPGGPVLPVYVMARTVCGATGCSDALEPVPEPSLSLGPHMSYAFQWWLLAAAAAPIAIALTRRDARLERERMGISTRADDAGDDGSVSPPSTPTDSPAVPTPRRPHRLRRLLDRHEGPTDEEIEDAL